MKPLLFALAATALQPPTSLRTRGLMSCDETYGPESRQCGPPESGFCYTPSEGQTCCDVDYGFCPGGTYCAPVPGQCCLEGETLEECATAASFDIPPSASASASPAPLFYPSNTTRTAPTGTACASSNGTACTDGTGPGPLLTSGAGMPVWPRAGGLCAAIFLLLF